MEAMNSDITDLIAEAQDLSDRLSQVSARFPFQKAHDVRDERGKFDLSVGSRKNRAAESSDKARGALQRLASAAENGAVDKRDKAARALMHSHSETADHLAAAGDHDGAALHQAAATAAGDYLRSHRNQTKSNQWSQGAVAAASQAATKHTDTTQG
jgi:hypothetical protein